MKTVPELVEVTRKVIAQRAGAQGQGQGTLRADVQHRQQKTLEATVKAGGGEFTFLIDEPRARGGLGEGANPLGYFLAGAGGCLLMQYVSLAIAQDLPIQTLSMIVRAHILRQVPCHFQDIVYDIFIVGSVSQEQVEQLAEEAIPVETIIHLNGKIVLNRKKAP